MAEQVAWYTLLALRQDNQEFYTIYVQLTALFTTNAPMALDNMNTVLVDFIGIRLSTSVISLSSPVVCISSKHLLNKLLPYPMISNHRK
jgi:hypothetical protein